MERERKKKKKRKKEERKVVEEGSEVKEVSRVELKGVGKGVSRGKVRKEGV